jgi:integrase
MVLGAILRYAQRRELITTNPIDGVERHPVRYSGDYDMYSREEIDAIIRCTSDDQDAAIILAAALTGLRRGELLALRWRDVDFAGPAIRVRGNLSYGKIVTPKSGKVRVVPMVDEVAQRLARLADRDFHTGDKDPVFASPLGGHLDGSALRRRFVDATQRAGLRTLPVHSLRHFLAPWPSTRLRWSKSIGWATRTSRPPPATCTTAPNTATRRCSPTPSALPRQIDPTRSRCRPKRPVGAQVDLETASDA